LGDVCHAIAIPMMVAAGVGLIVLALVLFLAEAHLSTGGLIGVCATIATVAGVAVLLVAAGASAAVVAAVAVIVGALGLTLLLLARRRILLTARSRPRTGREALVGHVGVVRSVGGSEAQVFIDGSLWRAERDAGHDGRELEEGDRVVIERVDGLTLSVRQAEQWELSR
jgi:membrane-bound ClpP family serine protease